MSRDQLLAKLRALRGGDPESDHLEADRALLEFIADPEVTVAFNAIDRWYA